MKLFRPPHFIIKLAQRISKNRLLEQDIAAFRTYVNRLYDQWKIAPYNPDTLVMRKGLQTYKKMREDAQVKAIQTLRKDARLSTEWDIIPASDEPADVRNAEFVRFNLDHMVGSIEDDLFEILSAMEFGYSVTEKNFSPLELPEFGGMKIVIDNLKTRNPLNFGLLDDDHGNLTGLELKYSYAGAADPIYELEKFIIYSHNKEFDNWYGTSDLRSIYKNWWSKDILVKFWNIALERFANPHFVGTYPEGLLKVDQDKFLEMLDNMQAASNAIIPTGYGVDILGGGGGGRAGTAGGGGKSGGYSGDFKIAIDYHNKMIARGLLTPSLVMDEGERGSFALGKAQFDIFLITLKKLGRIIEENIMGEQYIRPLVDLNFADVKKYPKFKFRPIEEASQEAKAKLIDQLIKAGVVQPDEPWIREFIGIQQKPAATSAGEIFPKRVEMQEVNAQVKRFDSKGMNEFYEEKRKEAEGKLGGILKDSFSDLEKKIKGLDFSKIKTIKDLPKIEIDLGKKYADGIKSFMLAFYNKGRKDVQGEIKKAENESVVKAIDLAVLEPEAALEWLDEYADFLADWDNNNVRQEVKQILFQGLKEGAPTSEIVRNVRDKIGTYVEIGGKFKPAKLEAMIRTNATLAYNQGRMSEMQDPEVKDSIPAYRYSAILDDRTTDICTSLDGRIWAADDPVWDRVSPPNHFNCRSTILPVFVGEEYELSDKSGVVWPAAGFGLTDKFTIPAKILRLME